MQESVDWNIPDTNSLFRKRFQVFFLRRVDWVKNVYPLYLSAVNCVPLPGFLCGLCF